VLHLAIVAADEHAHPCGIAAAADVLEQQGVIEVGFISVGQAHNVGNEHAVEAGPDGMAGYRAFGEVERKGERGEDLAHGNLRRRGEWLGVGRATAGTILAGRRWGKRAVEVGRVECVAEQNWRFLTSQCFLGYRMRCA
jgi:hypothetical protein